MESSACGKAIGIYEHLLEIFSWMPAKAVIKYMSSQSKTLSGLPYEPVFIERQSIRSSLLDGGFFLQPDTCWGHSDELDFHVLPKETASMFGVPSESLSFLQQNGRVLSSSQGLVLFHKIGDHANEFLICNPVTRSCIQLPIPEKANIDRTVLLECHPRNLKKETKACNFPKDYTITLPVYVEDEELPWGGSTQLAVYRNGKWDDELCDMECNLNGVELRLDTPVGIFGGHNGGLVIYYLCDGLPNASRSPVYLESYLVAYDVEKKMLCKTTHLPKGAWIGDDRDQPKLKIFKWGRGEAIGLVRTEERMFTVWVLDCRSSTWRKVMSKTILEMGVLEEDGDVVGSCILNGTGLVFATETRVYEYDMEAERLEVVAERGCRKITKVVFTPYANTLRPLCGEQGSIVTF